MTAWRLIRKEIETISNRYLVCVSGGVDSIFLVDFFRNSNVEIEIAHFNHDMRADSVEDLRLVEKYAELHDIPCWSTTSETLSVGASENEARAERWRFIEGVADFRNIQHIVTGHHADDQVENVFVRLMRGDPHHALTMDRFTEVNGFIRYKPLLDISKDDIIKQAKKLGLEWNEDSTNISNRYDRNFVRNVLLPLLSTRTNIQRSILTGIEKTREI